MALAYVGVHISNLKFVQIWAIAHPSFAIKYDAKKRL